MKVPGIPHMSNRLPVDVIPKFAASKSNDDEMYYNNDPVSSRSKNESKSMPIQIDDIPVGVHHRAATRNEEFNNNHNVDVSNRDNGDDADDSHIPIMERPIRPKGIVDYANAGDPDSFITRADSNEMLPPGEHPLKDVPNYTELPTPEALAGKTKELAENGIMALLGEYRCRCLMSKTWLLREAAIKKVHLMLGEFTEDANGDNTYLTTLSHVIKIGVEDKIQQVLSSAIELMGDVLKETKK